MVDHQQEGLQVDYQKRPSMAAFARTVWNLWPASWQTCACSLHLTVNSGNMSLSQSSKASVLVVIVAPVTVGT